MTATRTWSLCIERPARPGECTPAGQSADVVGWSVNHLRDHMLTPENLPNLVRFFEVLQARVCELLACDVSELTWRAATDLTDQDITDRIAALPIPPDAAVVIARVT